MIETTDLIEKMTCQNCKYAIVNSGNGLTCSNKVYHFNEDGTKVESLVKSPNDTCASWEERDTQSLIRDVYDRIKLILREYIDMKEDYFTLVSLWTLGTWFHSEFETYPFLFFNAMRGTAKSRILKLIATLENGGEYVNSLTEAVLFRQNNPLGIDEFEGLGSRDKQALRELLNSAYKKGAKVKRMRKKKVLDGESQVVETFDLYRPIHMANIWGMEEVLGDRCITLVLEKSVNKGVTKLMENFSSFPPISELKAKLNELSVVLCNVVTHRNLYMGWHNYIKLKYTPNYILHITTSEDTKMHKLFEKIDNADIDGRNLELFFPLFLLANEIGEDVLDKIIEIAKGMVEERKIEEITESKDVMMFEFIATQIAGEWYKVKELTTMFRQFTHDDEQDNPWLNTKWVGRALKRLQLIGKKRRLAEGIEVILNIDKAKEKVKIFQ